MKAYDTHAKICSAPVSLCGTATAPLREAERLNPNNQNTGHLVGRAWGRTHKDEEDNDHEGPQEQMHGPCLPSVRQLRFKSAKDTSGNASRYV